MRHPTPRRLWRFVTERLRLTAYVRAPSDGRVRPQIPAAVLLWALVLGHVLREWSFHGVEALVRSPARRALCVGRSFGDDTLAYFTERLDPGATRQAAAATVRQAKRNKASGRSGWIGLAIDGTGAGQGTIQGYLHHFALVGVVGTGLTLPFDVEPYGPGTANTSRASCYCNGRWRTWGPALRITSSSMAPSRPRRFCMWQGTWAYGSWRA